MKDRCWKPAFNPGLPVALAPANRVRAWARSQGLLAKTDALDARMIASYAANSSRLRLEQPPDPARSRLRALVRRRDFEVQQLTALRNHLQLEQQPDLRRMGRLQIRTAQRRVARLEELIDSLIESVDSLKQLVSRLEQPKGIGRITSASVIAEIPNLGRMGSQQVSAFAGLAPFNCDSGKHRGRRHIWGGQARVRKTLYMAALSAARYNPILRDLYQRLLDNGKPKKLAQVAVARKLIRLMERIAADPTFQPS